MLEFDGAGLDRLDKPRFLPENPKDFTLPSVGFPRLGALCGSQVVEALIASARLNFRDGLVGRGNHDSFRTRLQDLPQDR